MKKSLLTSYLKNQKKDQSFKIGNLTFKNMEELNETTEEVVPEEEVTPTVAPEVVEVAE